jgi:transcriptional regulator with XRE-family HTH domain
MAKQPEKVSDQIRNALAGAGVSRYAIAKQIGVSQALLSRFVNGGGGISLDVVDRLAGLLGLRVVVGPEQRPEKPRSASRKTTATDARGR